jgi:hypothetical protein
MSLKISRAPYSLTQTAAELTHHFTARQLPNLLLRQRHRFRLAVAEGGGRAISQIREATTHL